MSQLFTDVSSLVELLRKHHSEYIKSSAPDVLESATVTGMSGTTFCVKKRTAKNSESVLNHTCSCHPDMLNENFKK
jgi:hypothetical protein